MNARRNNMPVCGRCQEENMMQDTRIRADVLVCGGTACTASGSQEVMKRLREEIAKKGLS